MLKIYRVQFVVLWGVLCWVAHLDVAAGNQEGPPPIPAEAATTNFVAYIEPDEPTLYSAIVRPIIQNNCVRCHGPKKAKYKLRMDSPAGFKVGGKSGDFLIPGDTENSLMIQRITLPSDDIDKMPPPDEETPLSPGQIEVLVWWVGVGAPFDTPVAEANIPEKIQALLPAAVPKEVEEFEPATPAALE